MKFLALLFALFLFCSCKKNEPVACISSMDEKYEEDDKVTFLANCSENGFRYYWDFGDGNNSEEKNPEHIYNSPGTYVVELKVYSEKNKSFNSDFRTVTIKERPVSVLITSIILSSFPELNWLENSWDVGGLPDVRFQIVDGATIYLDGSEVAQNADCNLSYTYYSDFPITLPYSSNYFINVVDEDGVTDELVSVINFNPSSYSMNEESTVLINDGDCTLILKLQWVY
jgi:PKD repeat protein